MKKKKELYVTRYIFKTHMNTHTQKKAQFSKDCSRDVLESRTGICSIVLGDKGINLKAFRSHFRGKITAIGLRNLFWKLIYITVSSIYCLFF